MTTPHDHDGTPQGGPLSAAEREWALRLARSLPVEGPAASLDARILAAAHKAAVAGPARRRRHRFAWLGVPPAVVTGLGVAAAAAFALGVVWQVRPQYPGFAVQGQADGGEDIIFIAPPASAPEAVAPLPPPPVAAEPAPARRQPAAAARNREATAPGSRSPVETAAQTPAPARPAEAEPAPAPSPLLPDAAEAFPPPARPDGEATAQPAAHRRPSYTTAARAEAERRERTAAETAVVERESSTPDRIEAPTARTRPVREVDWARVPAVDDTRLAPDAWLQRIRARLAAGDTGNARASLRLFQREHPRIRLPDDLRNLPADPAP